MNSRLPFFLIVQSLSLLVSILPAQEFRILQVNSYHSDWIWIQEQREGFVRGLGSLNAVFRTVDLDSKNRDAKGVGEMVDRAVRLIDEWKPDLLFVTDDTAQKEISMRYLDKGIPIVYSGVNANPGDYGFDRAENVTGVLEREHFTASIAFLRRIVPEETLNLAIVIDDDPTWIGVANRIGEALKNDPSVVVTSWLKPATFADFKRGIEALQNSVDAIGMIGIFRFTGEDGKFVDYETVLRWMTENSRIPDFSFWDTRVERGTLCAVTVSGVEQGRIAGSMARRILRDRVSPADIPPEQSTKGIPMISLARARMLGIPINSGLLLNARVLTRFAWDK